MKQETPEEAARQRQEVDKAQEHLTEAEKLSNYYFLNELNLKTETKVKRCAA